MAQRPDRVVITTAGSLPTTILSIALPRLTRFTRRNPTMAAGMTVIIIMALTAILASVLFTADPRRPFPRDRFISPSAGHWFGTDNIGRDVYTRTIYGARVSMIVGFVVAAISMSAAAVIGLLSGYYRRVDVVVMRFVDALMSIPSILLALALAALLGGSVQNVIIALCVVETPRAVRVVRSSVISLREQMFVDAARALGVPTWRILGLHILPNTIAPLIVQGTFVCASAILIEAYLSFLGAGPPTDVPSWGNIMAEGRHHMSKAIWIILFPGTFLTITVLAINLAGDGLRDNLDPKLRRRM